MSKYFSPGEFEKCTPQCKIEDMDPNFLELIDQIREQSGGPLRITSAYRSPAYDRARGRSGTGAHTTGQAVDFAAPDSSTKFRIISAALACGVRRIGVSNNFVHIDNSRNHVQDILWTY